MLCTHYLIGKEGSASPSVGCSLHAPFRQPGTLALQVLRASQPLPCPPPSSPLGGHHTGVTVTLASPSKSLVCLVFPWNPQPLARRLAHSRHAVFFGQTTI